MLEHANDDIEVAEEPTAKQNVMLDLAPASLFILHDSVIFVIF